MAKTPGSTIGYHTEPGVVYFWGSPSHRIKIGFTVQPDMRLRTLRYQFGCIANSFLATVDGTMDLEREYHRRFAEHRQGKSEWFAPHPDILAEIERLATSPSHTEGAA